MPHIQLTVSQRQVCTWKHSCYQTCRDYETPYFHTSYSHRNVTETDQ